MMCVLLLLLNFEFLFQHFEKIISTDFWKKRFLDSLPSFQGSNVFLDCSELHFKCLAFYYFLFQFVSIISSKLKIFKIVCFTFVQYCSRVLQHQILKKMVLFGPPSLCKIRSFSSFSILYWTSKKQSLMCVKLLLVFFFKNWYFANMLKVICLFFFDIIIFHCSYGILYRRTNIFNNMISWC